MRVRMNAWTGVVMAVALSSAACGGGSDTPTSPTTTTPTVVDTYSGTIAIGGITTHAFPTASGGTISIVIESVGPVSTQALGPGVGVWDSSTCTLALSTSAATQGLTYEATTNALGNYCITLSDPGSFTEANTYQVRVTHPQG